MKSILLTFDLEEFDLPLEFDRDIDEESMYNISMQGLNNILLVLSKNNVRATFFTTANFAKRYPETIRYLSRDHEIASHGFSHSDPVTLESIRSAKELKERIIEKSITGFRAPRWNLRDFSIVNMANFQYDSSSHPIYLPGRYNNLHQPRYPHLKNGLKELPASTMIPNLSLFWLAFKNFPLVYAKLFTKTNFLQSDYTMTIQHPWEFADIEDIDIPNYIKNPCGKKLTIKLNKYIKFCKSNNYKFKTCGEFLDRLLITKSLKEL